MSIFDQDLFITPSIEKVASYKLSSDTNKWDEEVIEHIHEEYPDIINFSPEIVFKKIDKESGYGYGYISIGDKDKIQIPIIIRKYELSPFDVMLYKKKAFPLSDNSLKSILQKIAIGKPGVKSRGSLVDRFIGGGVSNKVYPGTVFNSGSPGTKVASVLSSINLSNEQLNDFGNKFRTNPELVACWNSSSCKDILKIANCCVESSSPCSNQEPKENRDLITSGNGHPLINAFIDVKKEDMSYKLVDKAGRYIVTSVSGIKYDASVFPNIYNFNLQPQDVMVAARLRFHSGSNDKNNKYIHINNGGAIQKSIYGTKLNERIYLDNYYDHKGSYGFFVIERNNKYIAFIPVKIMSSTKINEEHESGYNNSSNMRVKLRKSYTIIKIIAIDGLGARYQIHISPKIKEVKFINGIVTLPEDVKWIIMKDIIKLQETPEQIVKTGGKSITLRHLGGESISVDAPWAEDWVKEGAFKNRIKSYLSDYYNSDSLDNVLSECQKLGKVNINDRAPLISKTASKYNNNNVNKLRRDLTKEAAAIDDIDIVDKVLSLQFINKDNIGKFIDNINVFKEAASKLADLLIAARIGMNIKEYPIKTAMENLVEVIHGLTLLRGK